MCVFSVNYTLTHSQTYYLSLLGGKIDSGLIRSEPSDATFVLLLWGLCAYICECPLVLLEEC